MELEALGPLALAAVRFRTSRGEPRLTAIVKLTFGLVDEGDARLEPPLPLFDDVPFEDNEGRSLRLASDRAPVKARVDVLFAGSVYAPPLEPVARRELRFAVEDERGPLLDRRLLAVGDRRRLPSGAEGEPTPFLYLPIRFELAHGGASSRANPVGVGADPTDATLPNLLDPRAPKQPASLGPLSPSWWRRARYLGDAALPLDLMELPPGLERDYFNAAPPEQQLDRLGGAEWIVLEGLHPTMQRVRSRLPGVLAHARLETARGVATIPLRIDTLFVDGDTLRCALTFRGDIACDEEDVRLVATLAPAGEEPRFERAAVTVEEPPPPSGYEPPRSVVPASVPPASVHASELAERVSHALTLPTRADENVPIENETPFVVVTRRWQVTPPRDVLVVIAKGTFDLVDGVVPRSDKQLPPSGDLHVGDDEAASLRYPSDFAVYKPKADLLLVGHAYPTRDPRAREAPLGVARVKLVVGPHVRELVALGDRSWDSSGMASAPAPFARMPLVWERAHGGALSPDNPVGRGYRTGVLLPNLERVDARVRSSRDSDHAPVCFAPIDARWRPRAGKLGTYDGAWRRERWPYYPVDFDYHYFNAAPPELQVPFLAGDERFALSGVDPDRPTIEGALPGVRPHVYAQRTLEKGAAFFPVEMHLDTVFFDGDQKKLILVFRGLVPVEDDEASDLAALFVTEARVGETESIDRVHARFLARLPAGPSPAAANDATPAAALPPPPGAAPLARAEVLARLAASSSLAGANLIGADLSDVDLSGRDLSGAYLTGASLRGANLAGANLQRAVLAEVDAEGVSFRGADLTHATLARARLRDAELSDAKLEHATLEGAAADGARFTGASARGARFLRASLVGARFERADLTRAELISASLDRASFVEAKLGDARLNGARGAETSFERAVLARARLDRAVLTRCSFKGIDAPGSAWTKADLSSSTFLDAKLDKALFARAVLRSVILSRARARGALFRRAHLEGAQLLRCDAMRASFESADLTGADLRGANLYQVETWKAKLERARFELAHTAGSKLEKEA